ncbi:MAG: hypothetical protein QM487_10875 [Candidatus Marithrix sp.]
MQYKYDRALNKNEVLVCLIDKNKCYPDLSRKISQASEQYNFSYCESFEDFQTNKESNYLLKHVIIFDGLDNPESVTLEYENIISEFSSATLAISYSSKGTFNESSIKLLII